MTASAYIDDFSSLAGYTASGLAVSGGEVKASVDNSTVGRANRTYESVVPVIGGDVTVRVGVSFLIDTSMTAGTKVSVSLLDATSVIGHCVYVEQGVGIACGKYLNGIPGAFVSNTLLAWASLVNGGRYHIEWTCNPGARYAFFSLYDPNGVLILRSNVNDGLIDWFNITRLQIESNSNKTSVSRLAIDPDLTGSITPVNTGKYFTNTAFFVIFQSAYGSNPVNFYIPGGGNVNELAVYCHGAGQLPTLEEMTTYATCGNMVQAFLKASVMVVIPYIPDGLGGSDSWGNAYGAASASEAIRYARNLIGYYQAPVHLMSYSMGTLTATNLVGTVGILNVKSWFVDRGVCDPAYMEQNTGFASAIDTAWGVAHQANYAAAQATFYAADILQLLTATPELFEDIAFLVTYGTTGDTVVPQANNCAVLDALLTTQGITHRSAVRTYENHTEATTVGDATAHLEQIDSTGTLSVQGIATASMETILQRVLAGNYITDGTVGKVLQFLDALVSSRLAGTGYTTPPTGTAIATAVRTNIGTELSRIDTTISSRLAGAAYSVGIPLRGGGAISSVVSQTVFVPTQGPQNFNAEIPAGSMCILTDDTSSGLYICRVVSYVATTNRVTIDAAPPFTLTTDTTCSFYAVPKQELETYDSASATQLVIAKVATMLQASGTGYQYTADALELGPTGTGGSSGTGSTNINPSRWDDENEWRFESEDQLTAVNQIRQIVGFTGLLAMNLDNVVPDDDTLASALVAVMSPSSGITIANSTVLDLTPGRRKILVNVTATTTVGTYIVVLKGVTIDTQEFYRRGIFVLESLTGT